jgi:peptidoglycan glycosyltransferase
MSITPRYMDPSRRSARPRRTRRARPGPRRAPRRLWPGLAAVVLVGGGITVAALVIAHNRREGAERRVVQRFDRAWERADFRRMYDQLDAGSRRRVSRGAFVGAYRRAAAIATVAGVRAGRPQHRGDAWTVPVTVRTRAFGTQRGDVRLPVHGDPPRIAWAPELAFPGLRPGERLRRISRAPRRAPLVARDGRLLADRDGFPTTLGVELGIVGDLGRPDAAARRSLLASGFPTDTLVGTSGLERTLEAQLRGRAGGRLLAGRRVLASTRPVPSGPVRASIDPGLQRAAAAALGGRFGGVAVLEPPTGEVLALSGIALDGLQPPGSTFKIMTLTAALEAGLVNLRSTFPVRTGATVEGRFVANAHNEACGGDLTQSFAKSCNSVFAPLGARLGATRLVDVAQRFGFNRPPLPGIPTAKESTLPNARDMASVGEVGVSAFGQGRVLATPLQMAWVGATIADGGQRPRLTLLHGGPPRLTRITSPRVAALVKRLMLAVVNGAGATGTAAAISGVKVAGKTGTAELGGGQPNDAWFVAFAPADRPRVAVGVLVVHGGFGGDTAAPIAHDVLKAGLGL